MGKTAFTETDLILLIIFCIIGSGLATMAYYWFYKDSLSFVKKSKLTQGEFVDFKIKLRFWSVSVTDQNDKPFKRVSGDLYDTFPESMMYLLFQVLFMKPAVVCFTDDKGNTRYHIDSFFWRYKSGDKVRVQYEGKKVLINPNKCKLWGITLFFSIFAITTLFIGVTGLVKFTLDWFGF